MARLLTKTAGTNLAHREISTMRKKKRTATVEGMTWRRKLTNVNTAKPMLANKHSAAVRQNLYVRLCSIENAHLIAKSTIWAMPGYTNRRLRLPATSSG